jgi:phosphonate transport system substrate-binding protein
MRLPNLSLFAMLLCGSLIATAAEPSKPAGPNGRDKIAVGLPKTYGNAESLALWGGYFAHLSKCAKVDIVNQNGQLIDRDISIDLMDEKTLIGNFKSGKIQLGQFNPGLVPQIVSAGAPFAVPGKVASGEKSSYKLILIVRADSAFKTPKDLVGKKIAHTTPSSNSGNLAPRALFPAIGLTPEQNYQVVFSKGHERSVMGTYYGFWQGAAVASDLYQRMLVKEEIKAEDIRVLWESPPFITESWVLSNTLSAEKQSQLRQCTYDYTFPEAMRKLLKGSDHFLPVDYQKDFATVREVYEKTVAAAPAM